MKTYTPDEMCEFLADENYWHFNDQAIRKAIYNYIRNREGRVVTIEDDRRSRIVSLNNHTPTPWHTYNRVTNGLFVYADNEPICEMMGDIVIQSANAAFIVKAVNLHGELVKWLEYMVNHAVKGDGGCNFDEQKEKARVVLTKARENKSELYALGLDSY